MWQIWETIAAGSSILIQDVHEEHHATLALAIANQAAIAIENARLYEQAQELAAVEGRQKLARERHDSVSQALYGIALGLHSARIQLALDPRELPESLDYLLSLAKECTFHSTEYREDAS